MYEPQSTNEKNEKSKLQKLNGRNCTKKTVEDAQRNCAQMHKEAVHKYTKKLCTNAQSD